MDRKTAKQTVIAEIDRRADDLLRVSRDIHAHPELAYEEHFAHDILTEALTRFARDYAGRDREEILKELRKTIGRTITTRQISVDTIPEANRQATPRPPDKDQGPPGPPVVSP